MSRGPRGPLWGHFPSSFAARHCQVGSFLYVSAACPVFSRSKKDKSKGALKGDPSDPEPEGLTLLVPDIQRTAEIVRTATVSLKQASQGNAHRLKRGATAAPPEPPVSAILARDLLPPHSALSPERKLVESSRKACSRSKPMSILRSLEEKYALAMKRLQFGESTSAVLSLAPGGARGRLGRAVRSRHRPPPSVPRRVQQLPAAGGSSHTGRSFSSPPPADASPEAVSCL